MRCGREDIRRPRQRRWTGIVVTSTLCGALTAFAGLPRLLDFDNWQVCMMFAALSSASRCVVLIQTKDLRFHPTVINCSCFGIELMDNPAHYAVELVSRSANCVTTRLFMKLQSRISLILLTPCIRFQSSATENGVSHAPIQLLHGDFLKNSAVKDAISTAGLVYINNFKFGPELNLQILGVDFISTRYLLLFIVFINQTSNGFDSFFVTGQLCPLMPKG